MLDHIRLAHDTAATGSRNRTEIDPLVRRNALRCGRRSDLDARRRCRSTRRRTLRSSRWGGRRRSRRSGRAFLELAEQRVHLHYIAFLYRMPGENTRGKRGHLDGDLVSLELDERIARGHGVALFLEPAGHSCLDDRLAERRNLDCSHECAVPERIDDGGGDFRARMPPHSIPRPI